jgi:hypothetical protein
MGLSLFQKGFDEISFLRKKKIIKRFFGIAHQQRSQLANPADGETYILPKSISPACMSFPVVLLWLK